VPRSSYAIDWHIGLAYQGVVNPRKLSALARRTLTTEHVAGPLSLSIAVVDNRTIRKLNRAYRGVDSATDVLAFALGTSERVDDDGILGEVVIALPTARRQAADAGRRLDEELSHLLVHGILHILGYDHESTRGARRMRSREESLLGETAH
jgi:probable rRNA maturation factor